MTVLAQSCVCAPVWAHLATHARLPWPLWLFILSMIVPAEFDFELMGLKLSPQRLVLLACATGILAWVVRGRDLRAPDLLMIGAGTWAVLATFATMAPQAALERGGAFFLETAVAYLLPSAYLASGLAMRRLIRVFVVVVAILAPLAALESMIGEHFIADLAAEWMEKDQPFVADERLGLLRARVSFSHQILFGIFCASLVAFFWEEAASLAGRVLRTGIAAVGVFFSLSTAALLVLVLQLAMIAGERATARLRHRVACLAVTALGLWAAVEVAVQGGLAGFITRYLSLNPATGSYRRLIWTHVSDDIAARPWFGTAGHWSRPSWMVESIDHVYYAKALGYGVPTVALVIAAAVVIGQRLYARPEPPAAGGGRVRCAWIFAVLGLGIAGLTVDYFDRALPFVMFIIGLGAAQIRIAERHRAAGAGPAA